MQLLVQLPVPAASPAQLPQQLLWQLPGPAKPRAVAVGQLAVQPTYEHTTLSDHSQHSSNTNFDGDTSRPNKVCNSQPMFCMALTADSQT